MKAGERWINYYPAYLNLEGRLCLVVGGGKVAERKVQTLLSCGAKVVLVSPEATPKLRDLAKKGQIIWFPEPFKPEHLEGGWLVFACTNDKGAQREVFRLAEERKIFCNVVDQPELCSFIVPSVVKRGRLQLAISTSGASPALARRLRERLEKIFGEEYEAYLELIHLARQTILAQDLPEKEKEVKLQRLALIPWERYLKNKDYPIIEAILKKEGLEEVFRTWVELFGDKASKDREKLG